MAATSQAKRPEKPCTWCGRRTTSQHGTCHSCRHISLHAVRDIRPEHALTNGTWQPRGGVLVWHPNQQRSA